MNSFVAACVAALVLAVGTAYVLGSYQVPADKAFATQGVRL
jgi:hypothetical protein